MKFYPPLKLRVFVDNIIALMKEKTGEVAEMAKKVMNKLKEEVEKKGLETVSHRKVRKEKAI